MVHVVNLGEITLNSAKSKLRSTLHHWNQNHGNDCRAVRNEDEIYDARHRLRRRLAGSSDREKCELPEPEPTCFASHGSFGIVDLGATKTVIGSKLVPELLNSLDPNIRSQVTRCPCVVLE